MTKPEELEQLSEECHVFFQIDREHFREMIKECISIVKEEDITEEDIKLVDGIITRIRKCIELRKS